MATRTRSVLSRLSVGIHAGNPERLDLVGCTATPHHARRVVAGTELVSGQDDPRNEAGSRRDEGSF